MRKQLLYPAVVLLLVLAACGGDAGDTTTTLPDLTTSTTSAATTTTEQATTTTGQATTTTSTTSATTTSTTSTTSTSSTSTTFPGEIIVIGPVAGDFLAVVGVEHDDVLNVREKPGTDQAILTTLEPTFDGIEALGVARKLPQSIWYEVEAKGVRGWVGSSFVAYLGSTDDITSQVVDELGQIPTASSMDELADIVADTLVSVDPASKVTTTVAASAGDLGEITIDIIGLGDDSVYGLRVVIFGQSEDGGATYSLKSVESTTLCGRGVTEDGLCI